MAMSQPFHRAWRLKVSQDCLPLTIQNSLRIECLDVTVACCSFKQALIIKAIHFLGKTLPFKGKRKKKSGRKDLHWKPLKSLIWLLNKNSVYSTVQESCKYLAFLKFYVSAYLSSTVI